MPQLPTVRDRAIARRSAPLAVVGVLLLLTLTSSASASVASPAVASHVAVANSTAAGDWPMYLQNVARHAANAYEHLISVKNAPHLIRHWVNQTGGPIAAQPVESDGKVYFGSWDGYEYAANVTTGNVTWKTFLGQTQCGRHGASYGVSSTPTVQNGVVYLGGGGPYWYALSAATGKVLWSVFTGNNSFNVSGGGHYNWASPLIYKGNAYVGIASACDVPLVVGQVLKVNLTTHAIVATLNLTTPARLGASVWGSPSIDQAKGMLWVTSGNFFTNKNDAALLDDSLLEIDVSTMTLVQHWHIPAGLQIADGDFGAGPTLFNSATNVPMVGAVNKDGVFFAFDRANISKPVWTLRISPPPGNPVAPAAFDGSSLYLGGDFANVSASPSPNGWVPNGTHVGGVLWSVNATTGKVNWDVVFPGIIYGAPVYANGVVVAAGGHRLSVVDASNGQILFNWTLSQGYFGAASISHGQIFFGNINGRLYAFHLPSWITGGHDDSPFHPAFAPVAATAGGPALAAARPLGSAATFRSPRARA